MQIKKTIPESLKQTQAGKYTLTVVITTLLGIIAADGRMDWKFFAILAANWLLAAFFFILNDLINAPDDVFTDDPALYNPVAEGHLSPSRARFIAGLFSILSLGLFSTLTFWGQSGWMPLVIGFFMQAIGVYSAYRIRHFITPSYGDILLQRGLFTGLLTLSGFFAFSQRVNTTLVLTLVMVIALSAYHGLSTMMHDTADIHTISPAQAEKGKSERFYHGVMIVFMTMGMVAGVILVFFFKLIPLGTLMLALVLVLIFLFPSINLHQRLVFSEIQKSLYTAFERSTTIALLINFILPIILPLMK